MIIFLSLQGVMGQEGISLELSGGIGLGDQEVPQPNPGNIRWDGFDFVGWNGEEWVSLTGGKTGPVEDIDGNVYATVTIGDQIWMKENLRTTKYNNGDLIPNISSYPQWDTLTQPAWALYGNNGSFQNAYGKLYNGYAVEDQRNLCPTGWRIPDESDMDILLNHLGGDFYAARKLKEAGLISWNSPNDATNESGFTGRGGGLRQDDGVFTSLGNVAFYWQKNTDGSRYFTLINSTHMLTTYNALAPSFGYAFSVRCLKD